jgi:hypothetical protein
VDVVEMLEVEVELVEQFMVFQEERELPTTLAELLIGAVEVVAEQVQQEVMLHQLVETVVTEEHLQ